MSDRSSNRTQKIKDYKIKKRHKFITYPPRKCERRSVLPLRLNRKVESRLNLKKKRTGERRNILNYQAICIDTKVNYSQNHAFSFMKRAKRNKNKNKNKSQHKTRKECGFYHYVQSSMFSFQHAQFSHSRTNVLLSPVLSLTLRTKLAAFGITSSTTAFGQQPF